MLSQYHERQADDQGCMPWHSYVQLALMVAALHTDVIGFRAACSPLLDVSRAFSCLASACHGTSLSFNTCEEESCLSPSTSMKIACCLHV